MLKNGKFFGFDDTQLTFNDFSFILYTLKKYTEYILYIIALMEKRKITLLLNV
jgi:hypothetical protein